jgi:hypothetical protein
MKYAITGAAVAAALTLTGLSAHASCADPRTAARSGPVHSNMPAAVQQADADYADNDGGGNRPIVGTWRVSYTVEGSPFADAFIQWHGDGTEFEEINLPLAGGNICQGEWRYVDHSHVSRNHTGWLYSDGLLVGYFTEHEVDHISRDGNSYIGTNEQKIFDLNGNMLADVTGTSAATRLWPNY